MRRRTSIGAKPCIFTLTAVTAPLAAAATCCFSCVERRATAVAYQLLCAGDDDIILLEVVRGMGEALVGNHPGAALAATARKSLLPAAAESPPAAAQLPTGCVR